VHETTDKRARRLTIVGVAVLIAATVIIVRYATVMLAPVPAPVESAPEIERGPILDRRGRILAIQTRLDTVTAWKPLIADVNRTATVLGDILDLEPREIAGRLAATDGFLTIQRTITPSQSERILAEIRQRNLPGIQLEADTGRSYPEREAAAFIIGFTGVDNVGLTGIEYMFSRELLPEGGADGTAGQALAMGNQVFLTIDLAIQSAADDLGRRLLQLHQADNVTIVVGDVTTGQLLAVSTLPSFDPNHFRDYSAEERRNRFISSIYEPGSVFKVFSVASFLELGGITPEDRFNGGSVQHVRRIRLRGRPARDNRPRRLRVGNSRGDSQVFEQRWSRLRFGTGRPGSVLRDAHPLRFRGLLATPERWSSRTRPTIAIGQEIGVTAVQVFAAATVFGNDGVLLRPQIVDRVVSPTGEVLRRFTREPVREVLSPETTRAVLAYMDAATDPGSTARRIQVDGLSIAAKTGTAEVIDPVTRSYSEEHFLASTLALFPADEPELLVYIVIDYPRGESFYGGRIAAPAVDEMIEFLVPYWDIPRDTDTVTTHPGRIVTRDPTLPVLDEVIPDYTGLPVRTLLPLLGREDISVVIEGSGWVVDQIPTPGTPFQPGMTLRLELE